MVEIRFPHVSATVCRCHRLERKTCKAWRNNSARSWEPDVGLLASTARWRCCRGRGHMFLSLSINTLSPTDCVASRADLIPAILLSENCSTSLFAFVPSLSQSVSSFNRSLTTRWPRWLHDFTIDAEGDGPGSLSPAGSAISWLFPRETPTSRSHHPFIN